MEEVINKLIINFTYTCPFNNLKSFVWQLGYFLYKINLKIKYIKSYIIL